MRKAASIVVVVGLWLSGCSSLPEDPRTAVFAAKERYAVALTVAVEYESLPRCNGEAVSVCSEPSVVEVIRKVDSAAIAALDNAESVVRSIDSDTGAIELAVTSAVAAVNTMVEITSSLGLLEGDQQ
jgi:hypothetical protein